MTGLDIFLILVGVTSLTERLMKIIVYLDGGKYDGHCAYCGREIAYKDMQVDHFKPLRAWGIEDAGADDLDNLMPACRMCNHYKRANSLETFRRYIAEIPRKLRENYIYKVGIVYGEIAEQTHPVKFYFEQQEGMKNE